MIAPAITVAALVIGGLTWAIPAQAATVTEARPAAAAAEAALPSQCSQSGSTETCTFTTRGETEFTVPQNVGSIQVAAVGGHGGTSLSGTPGGLGAVASGTMAVTAGENLFLEVNVLGGTAGRDNGIIDGGAGGGESDVRTCGATATCSSGTTLSSRLLVAAGGGGGGSDDGLGHGGNAGTTGSAANGTTPTLGFANAGGGQGATTTAAGTGGASCGDGGSNGSNGDTGGGAGGAGGNSNSTPGNSGGGGGAGEFGGGGGGGCARAVDFGGSGGGGTSFAAASVTSPSFSQATASQAASVTLVFTAPFEVTTASLPDGTVDAAYNQTLSAANGTTPYSWQITGGALPDGLQLSSAGAITGTPTAAGSFSFTAQATDSAAPARTATAQLTITIDQSGTALSGTVNRANPSFGAGVTFTAAVTDVAGKSAIGGTVQFVVDGTDFGSPVGLVNGQATSSVIFTLSGGGHTVEMDYSGSASYQASTNSYKFTVGQVNTTNFEISASPDFDATVATPVTLTATATGLPGEAAPTGSVTFNVDGNPASCNPVTISAGQAQCALGDLSAGDHNFTAAYSGDTNYRGTTAGLFIYPVSKLTPSQTITVQPSSPTVGQGVTFTDTVTANGSAVTTGTVQWLVDGTDSGSPVAVGSDGTVTLGPVAGLSPGQHTIEADYSGSDQDQAASTQSTVTIGQATAGLGLAASPASGATVTTPVTLTATLTGADGVPAPTGSVTFTVDGQPASCGSVTISGGQAQCALGDLPAGTHDFGASYGGDTNYGLTSDSLTGYSVAKLTSSESISASPAAPVAGDPVTFTATVTAAGQPVSGGTVQWLVDGSDSGSPVPVAADGTATLGPVTSLSVGPHTIEADYSGSDQDAATSVQTNITVGQATPAVELSASPASGATVATPVTLTATMVGVAGVASPTGSVSFTVDGQPASCGSVKISGTTATCSLGDLAAGAHDFGASYGGDPNYQAATGSLSGYAVSKLTTSETIAPTVASPVFGQPVSFTATVTTGGVPVTTGSVQWLIDGTDAGSPVAVGADGTASLGPVSTLSVGTHTIEADYSGSGQDATTTQQLAVVVGMAHTATTIKVTGSALLATVTPVAPGAGVPTGTVTFTVKGKTVGTVKLPASGTARLPVKSSGAETASASYSGDASFAPSSAATATKNPKITAKVSSAHPKTKFGWYRSPVTITFTCQPGSAPLTGPCPAPVTLSRSAAAQMVSRTIHGQDGGIATVVISPINIDQVPPVVKVTGAKSGETVDAPGPAKLTCTATDQLSGLAGPCQLVINRTESTLTWTATATDKAGNTASSTGKLNLIDYFVAGAARTAGRFVVKVGRTYTVEAFILSATKAPKYVFAAPAGQQPHPVGPAMTKIGPHLWAIRIHITKAMDKRYPRWILGVRSGKTTHTIPITLKR